MKKLIAPLLAVMALEVETLSIYDSETERDKAVLEVCFTNKVCDKLIFPKEEMESKGVEDWFDMIVKKRGAK